MYNETSIASGREEGIKSVFDILLIYYALTYIFFFWRIESFVKDIFIAPLYFLVPTGIGLLFFSLFSTHKKLLQSITKIQLILSSSFIGFVFITLIYAHLNNNDLPGVFVLLYPSINLLSLYGFYNTREILRTDSQAKSYIKIFLILSLVFSISYYFDYFHFAKFPQRDIYQGVHFMKGAMELSKYYLINPATGNTYIPLIQVNMGVLNHFYNYDLINSEWIMPFYLFIFNYLCLYCFYSSFIKDRFVLMLALIFGVIFLNMFTTMNNQFVLSLGFVLFAIMINKNKLNVKLLPVILEAIILVCITIFLYSNRKLPLEGTSTFYPFFVLILFFMLLISYFNRNKLLIASLVVLMLSAGVLLHRLAILAIPCMLLIYILYFASFQWQRINNVQLKYSLLKRILGYGIVCLPAGVLVVFLVYKNWHAAGIYINKLFYSIYLLFGGDGAYQPLNIVGIGAEWLRTVPPAFHFMLVMLVGFVAAAVWKRNKESDKSMIMENVNHMIFFVSSTAVLLILYLSPLPHVYRIGPYIAVMIFAITGFMFKFYINSYMKTDAPSKYILIMPIAMLVYTIAARYIYFMPWKYHYDTPPYVSELFPIPEIGTMIMLIFLMVLMFRWKASFAWLFTLIILISGSAIDKFSIVSKLYENPYGPVFPEPKIISHYSELELKAAKWLGDYLDSPRYILISDPSTLGIFEAITGNNGFYTFSNLGLMLEGYANSIKTVFRKIFPPLIVNKQFFDSNLTTTVLYNKVIQNDNTIRYLKPDMPQCLVRSEEIPDILIGHITQNSGSFPEMEYAIHARAGLTLDRKFMEDNLLWIISEKTINWAYGDVGYYPQNKPFSKKYIAKYINFHFKIIYNANNQILILQLK